MTIDFTTPVEDVDGYTFTHEQYREIYALAKKAHDAAALAPARLKEIDAILEHEKQFEACVDQPGAVYYAALDLREMLRALELEREQIKALHPLLADAFDKGPSLVPRIRAVTQCYDDARATEEYAIGKSKGYARGAAWLRAELARLEAQLQSRTDAAENASIAADDLLTGDPHTKCKHCKHIRAAHGSDGCRWHHIFPDPPCGCIHFEGVRAKREAGLRHADGDRHHAACWWYVGLDGQITYSYDRASLIAWRDGDHRRFGPGADCYDLEEGDTLDFAFCVPGPSAVARAEKAEPPQPDLVRGSAEHVALWDAIERVVVASGGRSNTSIQRQKAVAEVERALAAVLAARARRPDDE